MVKIDGKINPADAFTKYVEAGILEKALKTLNLHSESGRAASAPKSVAEEIQKSAMLISRKSPPSGSAASSKNLTLTPLLFIDATLTEDFVSKASRRNVRALVKEGSQILEEPRGKWINVKANLGPMRRLTEISWK